MRTDDVPLKSCMIFLTIKKSIFMDWDDPGVKRWVSLLPACGVALVFLAFFFDNWLFHYRPIQPQPNQGFTALLIYASGQGRYVKPWEDAAFWVLLLTGWVFGFLTALMNRAYYGDAFSTTLSRTAFALLFVASIGQAVLWR